MFSIAVGAILFVKDCFLHLLTFGSAVLHVGAHEGALVNFFFFFLYYIRLLYYLYPRLNVNVATFIFSH